MTFQIVCKGCGAPSSPSVGVCPYCKAIMSAGDNQDRQSITGLLKFYNEGKLDRALTLGSEMYKSKPELKKNLAFIICFVKVLIETEAPSSKVTGILAEAHVQFPENQEILDYLEIMESKYYLKNGRNDSSELMLKNLIRRSPKNYHAHFILGSHLFWSENDPASALPYLEACVRTHDKFLRAWACLGAAYKKSGQEQLAQKAFLKCSELEVDQKMREFFKAQAA